jgi:thiol-disulfide isomerase/thioredoxin
MNIKLLFLFLILIISISILFYYTINYEILNSYDVKNINIKYDEKELKNDNIYKSDNKIKLILYWADWCGICNKIKPNWENAKSIIKNDYPEIEIVEINCNDPKIDKCFLYKNGNKTNLEGVPTILIRKNNLDVEYVKNNEFKGDRSVDELLKFCKNNLKK